MIFGYEVVRVSALGIFFLLLDGYFHFKIKILFVSYPSENERFSGARNRGVARSRSDFLSTYRSDHLLSERRRIEFYRGTSSNDEFT